MARKLNPEAIAEKFAEYLSQDEPDGTIIAGLQKVGRPAIYLASALWILSFVYMNVRAAHGAAIQWPPSHISYALVIVVVVGVLGRQWGKNKEIEVRHMALEDEKEI